MKIRVTLFAAMERFDREGIIALLVCVRSGVRVLDITLKENAVKTRVTRDELSTDGKVLTTTMNEFRPDGSVITAQIIFPDGLGPMILQASGGMRTTFSSMLT
jgi:hypothetical protein